MQTFNDIGHSIQTVGNSFGCSVVSMAQGLVIDTEWLADAAGEVTGSDGVKALGRSRRLAEAQSLFLFGLPTQPLDACSRR
ncbi:hypothetical protein HGI47_05425 [Novosphingobium sp. ERN07]|uniref:hypothetical protein n=1 Tax=Novosphingobium sp. ERN07 TaxID=2726187 RepID=UPI00145666A6|nr:hypothetical protein [Novosphingobium sp. ERN07]NLR70311.1 hypothetical protein [Novosphingobium sp. ERN07]